MSDQENIDLAEQAVGVLREHGDEELVQLVQQLLAISDAPVLQAFAQQQDLFILQDKSLVENIQFMLATLLRRKAAQVRKLHQPDLEDYYGQLLGLVKGCFGIAPATPVL